MKCSGPNCRKKITAGNKKYCSLSCKNKAAYLRRKDEPIVEEIGLTNRGIYYEKFVLEYASDIENKKITQAKVAELLEVNQSTVARMFNAYKEDKQTVKAKIN